MRIRALLIAGPTASGKSAAALALARRCGASIVNADSMQVYRDLSVLTARPGEIEQRLAPHRLFGEIDGAVNFSVGGWLTAAQRIVAEAQALGPEAPPLLFVGGTGLYFRALTRGLSEIPAVPEEVRARIRAAAEGAPTPELHARLASADPVTAARLRPSDRQRVLRALEVFAASGRPLASFQSSRAAPLLGAGEWAGLFLAPSAPPSTPGSRRASRRAARRGHTGALRGAADWRRHRGDQGPRGPGAVQGDRHRARRRGPGQPDCRSLAEAEATAKGLATRSWSGRPTRSAAPVPGSPTPPATSA